MSMTSDFSKRVNNIIVKNLPTDFTQKQLDDLFSRCGRILSCKIIPAASSGQTGYGFVNYADAESCERAIRELNNFMVKGSAIRVDHAPTRLGTFDRFPNDSRSSGGSNSSSPLQSIHIRPASERPIKLLSNHSTDESTSKSLSPNIPVIDIDDHETFIPKKTYNVYLSNIQVPNIVFVATMDDYINATLLMTQMNKHEQLVNVKANSYKSKLVVGQICAALFHKDWYRARVLEIGENRIRVQYIDWGNTGWCDTALEIRPLPNEYFKEPALCVKCFLDNVPSKEKQSDERTSVITNILVLDTKLEMTVVRVENGVPYIRLNLGERDFNAEIRATLSSFTTVKSSQILDYNSQKLELNLSSTHFVQLTSVDSQPECFHVLLMRDPIVTIMNVLKDWHAKKQPFTHPPKVNMLVCAQYELDDLWYRAWIESVSSQDQKYRVRFVDFGNEETVPIDRLTECPESLRTIPWQSVQIKLANVKLSDAERHILLKELETERLEMKILQKNQEMYLVDLLNNGKSLVEYILELRKKPLPAPAITPTPKPTPPVEPKNDSIAVLLAEQQRTNHLLSQILAAINTNNALLNQLVQR